MEPMEPMEPMERLGKYRFIEELGRGATSRVMLAFDEFNSRHVALKLVESRVFSDPEVGKIFRRMFVNEAALAGRLTHPNIVSIYDGAEGVDYSYIAAEYVPGGTLERHCKPDALLPVNDALELAFQCSRALEYANQLDITHRDIKPENILMADGLNVKVADFGAALMRSDSGTQVKDIGSPAYMSPQQHNGHPVDHRGDIYSLGVVLYKLLTGTLPFRAETAEALYQSICHATPAPPSALRHEIPPAVDALVARAMARELDDRYQSWDEFSLDLANAQRGGEVASGIFPSAEKLATLRALPMFREFSDAELWETVRLSTWHDVPSGAVIIREGTEGDAFFILVSGSLRVSRKDKLLNVISAGELIGEMAYIDREHRLRTADVAALSASRLVSFPHAALDRASDACRRRFDRMFLKLLAERVDILTRRVAGA